LSPNLILLSDFTSRPLITSNLHKRTHIAFFLQRTASQCMPTAIHLT